MAVLKRPKLKKREPDSAWTPPPAAAPASSGGTPYIPHQSVEVGGGGGGGISVHALNAALGLGGGGVGTAATVGTGGGVTVGDLGFALTAGGTSAGNHSVESTRHTSYPIMGDLTGLPAKAGTRRGPRTTSYRIPLQKKVWSNVYDTIN